MENNSKEKKPIREFIPLVIASTILLLLVVALVYTIIYKPKVSTNSGIENTLIVDEISVNDGKYVCEGKDINKLKEDAKGIIVAYEELDNYYLGKGENVDADPSDPEAGIQDIYGIALRTKFYGITDDFVVKIRNMTTEEEKVLTKADVLKDGYAAYDKVENVDQNRLDIRVYVNDDNCSTILLREFEVVLPRYNTLIEMPVCELSEYKNSDLCNKFVFNSNTFREDLEVSKREVNKHNQNSNTSNKKNSVGYIIAIVAIVIIVIVCVILMKGRMKHE